LTIGVVAAVQRPLMPACVSKRAGDRRRAAGGLNGIIIRHPMYFDDCRDRKSRHARLCPGFPLAAFTYSEPPRM